MAARANRALPFHEMDDITGLLGTGKYRIPAEVDGSRLDLALEFLRDPVGQHSTELQLLLGRMRSDTRLGRFVLIRDQSSAAHILCAVPRQRGDPLSHVAHCFSGADAERRAFTIRWQLHTGRDLAGDIEHLSS